MSRKIKNLEGSYCLECQQNTGKFYTLVATLFTAQGGAFIAQGNIKCPNCSAELPISSETVGFYSGAVQLQQAQNGFGSNLFKALFNS